MPMHPVAVQLNALSEELNDIFFERSDAIRVALLALLSKEHSFFLGVPGTAKSELIRKLVRSIVGARYFETALSKTRPPEKVLGPLDVARYRSTGEYLLKRQGYLTDVELGFVDEVGKMSPVLGHDLLALANERVIHEVRTDDDGNVTSVHDAPLYTMFTASNEQLTDDSDDAAAMWDRLLVRCVIEPIVDIDNFKRLMVSQMRQPQTEIEWSALKDVIDNVVPQITLSDHALEALGKLKSAFAREGLMPSDRRFRTSMKVMKAAAFLDGRDEVIEDDLVDLQFTLWDTVEQIDKVTRLCMACANPFVEPLLEQIGFLKEIDANISERLGPDANGNPQDEARQAYGKEAVRKLGEVRNALDALAIEAQGRKIPKFRQTVDEHLRILKRAFMECLQQDSEIAEQMMDRQNRRGNGYADQ